LRLAHLLGGVADQGHRGTPRQGPAQVGGEGVTDLEIDGAGKVAAGEGTTGAKIDDPLAGVDTTAQLHRVDRLGQRQIYRGRALQVDRGHVGVVPGVGGEPIEEASDEGVLVVDGEGQVGLAFLADGAGVRAARGRRGAEAAKTVRRMHAHLVGELGEAAHGAELRPCQLVGAPATHEVGAPDRAEQHRPAGEDRCR